MSEWTLKQFLIYIVLLSLSKHFQPMKFSPVVLVFKTLPNVFVLRKYRAAKLIPIGSNDCGFEQQRSCLTSEPLDWFLSKSTIFIIHTTGDIWTVIGKWFYKALDDNSKFKITKLTSKEMGLGKNCCLSRLSMLVSSRNFSHFIHFCYSWHFTFIIFAPRFVS